MSGPARPVRSALANAHGTLLPAAQIALVASIVIVAAITGSQGRPEFGIVVLLGAVLAALSLLAFVVPWPRISADWLILVPVADLVVVTLLRENLFDTELGLGILALIPLLWLSYSFGFAAMLLAVGGAYFVAIVPFLRASMWPPTPHQWATVPLTPAVMSLVAVAVYVVAVRQRRQRTELVAAHERLRVSVAEGANSAAALRESVAEGLEGEEALRLSIADGVASADALRAADARTAVSADALRVSVAHELDGAEALRVSIANGLDAASAALAVVDTVDAGITFYDTHGTILLTNDTARALAESAGSVAAGEVLSEIPFIFEADRVTPIAADDQVMARAARGELITRRLSWMGQGIDQKALLTTSRFVRRESGALIGTVIATHDVTPLAEAIQSRDEFLTTVSHELRTPLTIMMGFLELIEDSIDLEAVGVANAFEAIQRNSRRLFALITDLLAAADADAPVDRRSFDIAELSRRAADAVRPAAAAAGLTVTTALPAPVPAEVNADQISSVLEKVLSNALAFTPPGGAVHVTAESDAGEAVVRIVDTGIGMTDVDRAQIFRRFFRSARAREDAVTGAGLGLSTAKIIVDAHHGSIAAQSELGVGTTIEIRLPRLAAREPSAPTTRDVDMTVRPEPDSGLLESLP